jgi:hypothetical protein
MAIKFKITPARVNEVLSPVEYFGLVEGESSANYNAMLKFMVNEKGEYLSAAEARERMKAENMQAFWAEHLPAFAKALKDAFVSPTNAGG